MGKAEMEVKGSLSKIGTDIQNEHSLKHDLRCFRGRFNECGRDLQTGVYVGDPSRKEQGDRRSNNRTQRRVEQKDGVTENPCAVLSAEIAANMTFPIQGGVYM